MKHLFVAALIMLAVSCGSNTVEAPGSISEQTQVESCDCKTLQIDSLGTHMLNDEPFTGTCISYYEGTENEYLRKNILNGLLHGKVEYYDRSGEILLEESYENGKQKRTGDSETGLTCDCSELTKQEMQGMTIYKLDDVPFTGRCEKFYADSPQLYMESNYKKGILDGYTIYYNRDGSTILMEKYEAGVMVSTVH